MSPPDVANARDELPGSDVAGLGVLTDANTLERGGPAQTLVVGLLRHAGAYALSVLVAEVNASLLAQTMFCQATSGANIDSCRLALPTVRS